MKPIERFVVLVNTATQVDLLNLLMMPDIFEQPLPTNAKHVPSSCTV